MTKFTLLKTILLALTLVGSNVVWGAVQISEGFETGLPTAYTTTTSYTLNSGTWTGQANGVARSTTGVKSNTYSLQLRSQTGAQITSPNISTGGVSTIVFWASGSTTSSSVQVNYSTNGGQSWMPATGSPFSVTTGSAVEKTATINTSSTNVLVQFYRTNGTVYIDDVTINSFETPTSVSNPTISATGTQKTTDNFFNTASITLSSTTDGASIYYTTNGDEPSVTSTLYSVPFDITSTTTIKAIAIKSGLDNSVLAEKTITITVGAPVATEATTVSTSGFTANWNAVPVATEYELRVISKAITGTPSADLFFSEYIEGSSNNKAIEIYNGTGSDINLSAYTVEVFGNGEPTTPTYSLALSGTLFNNDVYVIYNSGANSAIKEVGDVSSTVTYFNGDDAVVLKKNGTILDIIGRIGEDPGTEWTATGGLSTVEKTLVRKSSVVAGISVNPSAGFPTLETEWDLYDQDASSNLGSHTFSSMTVTENPISGSPFTVSGENSKTITGLDENKTYYYKVIAKNGSALSVVSNEISVTTSTTTVLNNHTQNLQLRNINGNIIFNTSAGKIVNVYNSVGQRVSTAITTEGNNTIPARVRGVVFVKIGSEISKLIVE